MKDYLSKTFPVLLIQSPLFYSSPIGIRFEIGSTEIPLWKDSEEKIINEEYFTEAYSRAENIFESIFQSEDEIIVLYQMHSDGRQKIKKKLYLFEQIKDIKNKNIIYSDEKNIYYDDSDGPVPKSYCWKRAKIELRTKDINYKNILNAQINTDFGIRGRRLRGECYFINKTKNIILHLYDDRGMDVIATDKKELRNLYSTHNEWILDYDREKINSIFK